jgi:hypothetical protein
MHSEQNEPDKKSTNVVVRTARTGLLAFPLALSVLLVGLPARAEFIEPNEIYGFVAAGNSGNPVGTDTRFSFNYAIRDSTSSASNTVTRLGRGHYRVDFPQLGQPTGVDTGPNAHGIVEVTGFNVLGNLNIRCKPYNWYATSTNNTLSVEIYCFTPAGAVWDAFFLMSYLKRWTDFVDPVQDGAYVYVSNLTSAIGTTYTVSDPYSWNSMQQPITVTRVGTGQYDVYFVGQRPGYPFQVPNGCSEAPPYSGGTVEVTAVGSSPEFCKVWNWWDTGTATYVRVNCFDVNGNFANSRFNVKYSNSYPIGSPNSGIGWMDGINTPVGGSSNAGPNYSAELTAISDGNLCGHYEFGNNGQAVPVLTHSGTGKYGVRFPAMGCNPMSTANNNPFCGPASAMFTPSGDGADYCNFAGWNYSSSLGMILFTQCYGSNGALKDVQFDVSYAYEGWRVQ